MEEPDIRQSCRSKPALRIVAGTGRKKLPERPEEEEARPLPPLHAVVAFDRRELNILFNLYGSKVAAGEWRDYALDFTPARAVFSIYRRSSDMPLYRIEKVPERARRQGAYAVIAANGQILRRGHDLGRVIRVLDRALRLVGVD